MPVEFKFRHHLGKDPHETRLFSDLFTTTFAWHLGLPTQAMLLSRLDDDEKGVALTETLGGPQEMNVINEFGLYRLILTKVQANAKKFSSDG